MQLPYWVNQDACEWLNNQQYADRKNEQAMQTIADECNQRFGTRYALIRCVPRHGDNRGQFVGYNIGNS